MRKGAGRLGDDGRIAGIGLRLTRMEVGDASHRQARQVGDEDTLGLSDRDRQRADRGRLVDHKKNLTVLFQLPNDLSKFRFVVG